MTKFTFEGITGRAEPYMSSNGLKGWYIFYGGMGFHLSDIEGKLADYLKKVLSN